MRPDIIASTRRDADNLLVSTTLRWQEDMPFVEQVLLALATGGGLFGLLVVVFVPLWGGLLLLGGIGAFVLAVYYPGRQREMTFTAEGEILTPYGFAHWGKTSIQGGHGSVTSIESRPTRVAITVDAQPLHEVILTSEYGALFPIARHLREDAAFKVAVLLSRQLQELRIDQAARAAQGGKGQGPSRDTEPAWGYVSQ